MRAAVLRRGPDQKIGVERDAAVGEVIVGEHDQNVGLSGFQFLGNGSVGVFDNLLGIGRCAIKQTDDSGRVRCTGCKYNLSHALSCLFSCGIYIH